MLARAIDDITLNDILALVDNRLSEGRRLEYKRDHYSKVDEAKREFAADISAMANSISGDIILGIKEENGIASQVVGIESSDPDKLVLAVLDSIRSTIEPQVIGVRVRWLEMDNGRGVLVIRVPRSWSAPHRVVVAKDNRFFVRDENGKHPMSVEELRRAFLFATEIEVRIREFRANRLQILTANEGPLAVTQDDPRLILHLVPLAAFTEGLQISLDENRSGIGPLGASGWTPMYSIDGLVNYSGPEERFEAVPAFTTQFRNGIVEAVASVGTGDHNGVRAIFLDGIEHDVIKGVRRSFTELNHYGVPAPYYLMLSLIGVRGLCAPTGYRRGLSYPHRADRVLLPEFKIDQSNQANDLENILHPLFNILWNAFGQRGSPNIDASDTYRRN